MQTTPSQLTIIPPEKPFVFSFLLNIVSISFCTRQCIDISFYSSYSHCPFVPLRGKASQSIILSSRRTSSKTESWPSSPRRPMKPPQTTYRAPINLSSMALIRSSSSMKGSPLPPSQLNHRLLFSSNTKTKTAPTAGYTTSIRAIAASTQLPSTGIISSSSPSPFY